MSLTQVSANHGTSIGKFHHKLVMDWANNVTDKYKQWLTPPDPWKNHYAACKLRHPGTAEWFIHGDTFLEWKTSEVPGSLLWVHGKRLLLL